MANIGDKLTNPESGMKRLSFSNCNIHLNGNFWSVNKSNANFYRGKGYGYWITTTVSSNQIATLSCNLYVYTSKLYLLLPTINDYTKQLCIEINGEKEYVDLSIYGETYQYVRYKKEFDTKQFLKIKIYSKDNIRYALDCLDIDEDGCMVYCDENGKLYYDVTPIMTSNTTPSPYVVSTSTKESVDYDSYKVFDGSTSTSWCTLPNASIGWLSVGNIDEKIKLSSIGVFAPYNYRSVNALECGFRNFKIEGSDDNSNWDFIKEFSTDIYEKDVMKIFNIVELKKYHYFRIYEENITNRKYVCASEIKLLIDINTPFYLIQDNSNDKIYNYDETNNQLVEVSDISILYEDAINNTCIYNLNKVKNLIDLTDENISILSNKNVKLNIEGIKSDKELIVSNQNLSTVNAETIHNFIVETNKIVNGDIKFVISNDNGVTWQTWDGSNWTSLTNTCLLKKHSQLSDSEKIQWDKFKDEIWSSGISTDETGIDYNTILTNKTVRFAFVLYRPTYEDNISLTRTNLLYNKIGAWHKLSEEDIDIAINSNSCVVTPKLQNLENVKVNILI